MVLFDFVFGERDFFLAVVLDCPDLVGEGLLGLLGLLFGWLGSSSRRYWFLLFLSDCWSCGRCRRGSSLSEERFKTRGILFACPVANRLSLRREEVAEGLRKVTVGIEPVGVIVFVQLQNFVSVELDLIVGLFQVVLEHVVTGCHRPRKQLETIENGLDVVRWSLHVFPLHGI